MSQEITPPALQGKLNVTAFYGGAERGPCIQLTPVNTPQDAAYAQLTLGEVVALETALFGWITDRINRKELNDEQVPKIIPGALRKLHPKDEPPGKDVAQGQR